MVKQRDVTLRQAHLTMTMLKAYVQTTANAEPERAEAIVHSAGMNVAKPRTRTKLVICGRRTLGADCSNADQRSGDDSVPIAPGMVCGRWTARYGGRNGSFAVDDLSVPVSRSLFAVARTVPYHRLGMRDIRVSCAARSGMDLPAPGPSPPVAEQDGGPLRRTSSC